MDSIRCLAHVVRERILTPTCHRIVHVVQVVSVGVPFDFSWISILSRRLGPFPREIDRRRCAPCALMADEECWGSDDGENRPPFSLLLYHVIPRRRMQRKGVHFQTSMHCVCFVELLRPLRAQGIA